MQAIYIYIFNLIQSTMQTDLCVYYGFCLLTDFGFLTEMPCFLMAGAAGPDVVFFVFLFLLCLCFSCVCLVATILQHLLQSYTIFRFA